MKKLYRNLKNFLLLFKTNNIYIGNNVYLNNSFLEGKNKLDHNTVFAKSRLGWGSYIGTDGHFGHTTIGKYCSIGNRVKIVSSTHPANTFVSTHPAFFSLLKQAGFTYTNKQCFEEFKYLKKEEKISVSIGNDVWIGDEVMIIGGVRIHDGAIIGSKALVTKDVAPYTMVGGVPAKEIGKRFDYEEIEFLLKFKWWNKDEKWISENTYLFSDVKRFIKTNKNISD